MKKKKNEAITIMFFICVFLVFVSAGLVLFVKLINEQKNEMQKLAIQLEEKNNNLQTELEESKSDIKKLKKELKEITSKQSEEESDIKMQEDSKLTEEATIAPPKGKRNSSNVNLQAIEAGTILSTEKVIANKDNYFSAFDITESDDVYNRIIGKSYRENENVGLADLKYLKMAHYNFDHQIQMGEMIVNVAIYEDVLNVFKELLDIEYEVQSMYLVDNYWTGDGDSTDSASIDVNNTSSFNYRPITGGSKLSNHAYGRAIDLNPQQNPYVTNGYYSHENAAPYIDRACGEPHVIVAGDSCYNVFKKYGFSWGGEWENPKDYQHFEKSENSSY